MSTSLHDTQIIEKYLSGRLTGPALATFKVRLLTDSQFELRVQRQKAAYETIKYYGRVRLRKEIETVRKRLFTNPGKAGFREKVNQIFKYSSK